MLYVAVQRGSLQQQLQVHRLDDHVFLFGTGLVGDVLFLASHLRTCCQMHRLDHGEAPTIREVAEKVASFQHQQTRQGGTRPLGCTAIVAGVDPFVPVDDTKKSSSSAPASTSKNPLPLSSPSLEKESEDKVLHPDIQSIPKQQHDLSRFLQLFRCSPGGIMEDVLYCAAGKDENALMSRMTIEYPSILKQDKKDEENTAQPPTGKHNTTILRRLVSLMLKTTGRISGREVEPRYDVWTIEPIFGRRGNLRACCHCGVSAAN